jgi:hypothetical protein
MMREAYEDYVRINHALKRLETEKKRLINEQQEV